MARRKRSGKGHYHLTRSGKLTTRRTAYTCGTAIRRGRRMGLCRNPVDGPRDRCHLHKGGAASGLR